MTLEEITSESIERMCHTLVFCDGGDAVLIDTGLGIGDLRSFVKEITQSDVRVLLTHSHWDHIGAAHQFDNVAIHDRERSNDGRVSIDILSDEFSDRPAQFTQNYLEQGYEFPDGFDPNSYTIEPIDGVDTLAFGEEVDVGDRTLELVSIPGHSPGQLAVLDRTSSVCHGADILEPDVEIFVHFWDSDLDEYRDTIDRLVTLRDEKAFDTLTTSHGDLLQGDDLSILDDAQMALERVTNGDAPFEVIETNWGPTRKYSIEGISVLTKGA